MDTSNTTTKTCTKCGNEYPATTEYFYRQKDGKYGFRADCKECFLKGSKSYREKHVDEVRARARKYQQEHSEARKAYLAQWYAENKQRHMVYGREYRKAHVEQTRANSRKQYRRNLEFNRLKGRAKASRYYARKRLAVGTYTAADIQLQLKSQRGLCWHCGKPVGDTYQADHLIPLSRGGSNAPENIVISCAVCNQSRGAKLPQEWNGRLF